MDPKAQSFTDNFSGSGSFDCFPESGEVVRKSPMAMGVDDGEILTGTRPFKAMGMGLSAGSITF